MNDEQQANRGEWERIQSPLSWRITVGTIAAALLAGSIYVALQGGVVNVLLMSLFAAFQVAVLVLITLETMGVLYGRRRKEPAIGPEAAEAIAELKREMAGPWEKALRWLDDRLQHKEGL